MIGEDGRVYRDKPYPQPTPEFTEAINNLRRELERGPKTTMTPEYTDDDKRNDLRRKLLERNGEIAEKAKALGLSVPEYIAKLRAERANAPVHGSDMRKVDE